MDDVMNHKRILLSVADGPESIEIYTSDERGMIDLARNFPAVYVNVSMDGVAVHLGPFTLPEIYKQLEKQL